VSDRASTEIVVQPGQQGRREQPHLRGPRCGVGPEGEASGLELLWDAVVCDLDPHDLGPPAFDTTNRECLLPPTLANQLINDGRHRLRVTIVWART
jgi:hypothetical protein